MKRIMKKEDLACELASRTNFFKKNMREVVNALADIVIEQLQTAEFDKDSEFHLAPGIVLCGRRTPEHESIDPRNRETIVTPEKVIRVIFYIGLPCDIGRCLIVRIFSDDEPGVADGHALDNDIALIDLLLFVHSHASSVFYLAERRIFFLGTVSFSSLSA